MAAHCTPLSPRAVNPNRTVRVRKYLVWVNAGGVWRFYPAGLAKVAGRRRKLGLIRCDSGRFGSLFRLAHPLLLVLSCRRLNPPNRRRGDPRATGPSHPPDCGHPPTANGSPTGRRRSPNAPAAGRLPPSGPDPSPPTGQHSHSGSPSPRHPASPGGVFSFGGEPGATPEALGGQALVAERGEGACVIFLGPLGTLLKSNRIPDFFQCPSFAFSPFSSFCTRSIGRPSTSAISSVMAAAPRNR